MGHFKYNCMRRNSRPFEWYFEKAIEMLCKKSTWDQSDIYVDPFFGFNQISVQWTDVRGKDHKTIMNLSNTMEGDGE